MCVCVCVCLCVCVCVRVCAVGFKARVASRRRKYVCRCVTAALLLLWAVGLKTLCDTSEKIGGQRLRHTRLAREMYGSSTCIQSTLVRSTHYTLYGAHTMRTVHTSLSLRSVVKLILVVLVINPQKHKVANGNKYVANGIFVAFLLFFLSTCF